MRVLVMGYNACDVIVPVAGSPEPDSKVEVPDIRIGGGGPAATAAVALARLGAEVKLITPLSLDLPGRMQALELTAAGIDITDCPRHDDHPSPRAVILVDARRQERTIYWSRGSLPLLEADEVREAWLEGVDLFYTDGHETRAACVLAHLARARGLPVVMDAGSVRPGSAELAAACSDVISSTLFARQLSGLTDPPAALRFLRDSGPPQVGMTFGRSGSLLLVDDRPVPVPAFAVDVVDTTGAGDVFHAGYAFARGLGADPVACMAFGSATAALKCRGWGGRSTLPDRPEVERLLAADRRLPLGENLARWR